MTFVIVKQCSLYKLQAEAGSDFAKNWEFFPERNFSKDA